ncbi:hypothetical protein KC357_g79 [Hortaea werneckii]|nr:hypothetical protein KC357_g79 [Hortaea werneckii]
MPLAKTLQLLPTTAAHLQSQFLFFSDADRSYRPHWAFLPMHQGLPNCSAYIEPLIWAENSLLLLWAGSRYDSGRCARGMSVSGVKVTGAAKGSDASGLIAKGRRSKSMISFSGAVSGGDEILTRFGPGAVRGTDP